MKKLWLFLMLVPSVSLAQGTVTNANSLLTIPGLTDAVAQMAKSSRAIGLMDFTGKLGTGVLIPLRTLHDSQGINYLQFGGGGDIKQGTNFKPLFIGTADFSAIVRRLENSSAWYTAHVTKLTLPDFWGGVYIDPAGAAYDGIRLKENIGQIARSNVGLVVTVGI